MERLTRQLDLYCERLGPEFWAEPFNAITNGAFILAAITGYLYADRKNAVDWPIAVLVIITTAVGIGSFLFHTFATVWAVIADVVPIQLFIVFYFVFAMRRFAGLPWWGCALATVAFMAFSVVGGGVLGDLFGDRLNGSEGYLPPLLGLLVVGGILVMAGRTGAGFSLLTAAIIFAVSLTFRTVDMAVCDAFPLGTHFLWHALNGLLLGFLIVAMAAFGRPRGRAAAAD
ncbi:MAG: ceramidase domain-containing protein [Pseudomonadota bacterium]